jgi:hypothetical protein
MNRPDEGEIAPVAKPFNSFWAFATAAVLVVVWQDLSVLTSHIDRGNMSSPLEPSLFRYSLLFGQSVRSIFLTSVNYFGLALVVELADRIRWQLLSREEQLRQRPSYLISRLRR